MRQRVADHAAALHLRCGNDERAGHAPIVEAALRAGEGHAVIAHVDDQRVRGAAGFLQRFEQKPYALIEPVDGLVILGQLGPHLGIVGQKRRHDHVGRRVDSLLHVGVAAFVGEASAGAMRIAEADMQVERPSAYRLEEAAGLLRHAVDVACRRALRSAG